MLRRTNSELGWALVSYGDSDDEQAAPPPVATLRAPRATVRSTVLSSGVPLRAPHPAAALHGPRPVTTSVARQAHPLTKSASSAERPATTPMLPFTKSASPAERQTTTLTAPNGHAALSTDRSPPRTCPSPDHATTGRSRKLARIEDTQPETPPRDASAETDNSLSDGLESDDNWKCYQTHLLRSGLPEGWGIINQIKRWSGNRQPTEGKRLQWCIETFQMLLRGKHDKLEHKVGICYDAKVRFEYYREDQPDNAWRPHFMVLVDRPSNREAAGFLESALMMYTTTSKYFSSNSVNRRRNDVGGAGPRQPNKSTSTSLC